MAATPAPKAIPTVSVQPFNEVIDTEGKRIAIIGESGAGKTWLAATFPRPAFIDADFNIQTLKQESFKKFAPHVDVDKIKVARMRDPIDPKTGLFTSAVGWWQFQEALNIFADDPEVETLVIDTVTTIGTMAMHVGLEVAGTDGRSQTLKEARRDKVPLYTIADFGAEMNVMEQILDQLPMINKHVIFNCHVRTNKNEKGSVLGYEPFITGDKHRGRFGSWFNEVWWLEVSGYGDRAKRVLITQPDASRKNIKTTMDLPPKIEEPTFEKIWKNVKRD